MGIRCAVTGCYSSEREKKRAFFRFPKNRALCTKWIIAAGRPDLEGKDVETVHKAYRICDLHFDPHQRFKKKIKANSIPTYHLPESSADVFNRTKTTQTETDITCYPTTSIADPNDGNNHIVDHKKESRKRTLSNTSLDPYKAETMPVIKQENIPFQEDRQSKFIVAQKRIEFIDSRLKEIYQEDMYNVEYRKFFMDLYFTSPSAYRLLYKTLKLPSEKVIKEIYIDVDSQFSDNMIRCLQFKCSRLSESEKICVLSLAIMELKSETISQTHEQNARLLEINGLHDEEKYAVVLMARGLLSKWKQLIAFWFYKQVVTHTEVTTKVIEIINLLKVIGFDVVAITTDNEALFYNLTKCNISLEPRTRPIYNVFDVPHLMNTLRNILMTNNFVFRSGKVINLTASWDDIKNLYSLERTSACPIAYNLTAVHLRPSIYQRSAVRFAAQIFSRSVASAMHNQIENRKLPSTAVGTAVFIQRTNDAFDILNSSPNDFNDSSKFETRFSGEPCQTNILVEYRRLLSTLRIISKTNNKDTTSCYNCLSYFNSTIESALLLLVDLKNKGYNYFYTRRLNTDELKKLFQTWRQQDGVCREISATEFCVAFKKQFINAAIDIQRLNSPNEFSKLFAVIKEKYKDLKMEDKMFDIISSESEELEEDDEIELKSNQSEESEEEEDYTTIDIKPTEIEEVEEIDDVIEIESNQNDQTEYDDIEFIDFKPNECEEPQFKTELIEAEENEDDNKDDDSETQEIKNEIEIILSRNAVVGDLEDCIAFTIVKTEDI